MAPQPVGGDRCTWELLAVHAAGDAPPCIEGHPCNLMRIYVGVVNDDGEAGVTRIDRAMCAGMLRTFMERFNR